MASSKSLDLGIRNSVVLLLLLLGGPASVRAEEPAFLPAERLPRIGTVGDLPPEKERLVLEADAAGHLRSSGSALDLAAFRSLLRSRAEGLPEEGARGVSRLAVVLRVDGDLPWVGVQWLLRECAGAGVYRTFFGARPEDGGDEGAMAAFLPADGAVARGPGDAPRDLDIECKHMGDWAAVPPADAYPFLVSRYGPSGDPAYRVLVNADSGAPAASVIQLMDMAIRWGSRDVMVRPRVPFPAGKSLEEIVAGVKKRSGPFQVTVGGSAIVAEGGAGRRPAALARAKGRLAGVAHAPPPCEDSWRGGREPPPDPAPGGKDEREEMARSLAGQLAERGYPVDLRKIRIEVRSQDGMAEDILKQGGILLSPTYFAGFAAFSRALHGGKSDAVDGESFAKSAAKKLAAGLIAYYQPGEKRLVFKRMKEGDALSVLADGKHTVAHELVHAYQDEQRGLEKLFGGHRATVEGTRLMSCLIEGEAEAVALSLQIDLKSVEAGDLSSEFERLIGGEITTLVYAAGRTFMVARYCEGGWKAVAGAFADPPPSTEQILHPEKRGQDLPATVAISPLAMPLVHQDVLGELEIRRYLLEIGTDHGEAYLAAAGWDADLLRVHRDAQGGEVILWRTLWDRTKDAEQFARVLEDKAGGNVVRNGRLVDWYSGSTAALAESGRRVLAENAASPPVVEADAATADSVEAAWAARRGKGPKQEGETWLHESAGVRIPIPEGWQVIEYQGMQVLADVETAAQQGFAPNFTCMSLPLPAGQDLDTLLEANRAQLARMPALTLVSMEKATLGGVPALRYEYHGAMAPKGPKLHFLGVILIRGKRQVVVTATTLDSLWEKQGALLAETMAGIRTVEAAPPGGK